MFLGQVFTNLMSGLTKKEAIMKHLLFLLVLLLVALPAQATKPDTYTDEFWDYIEIVDCGDFSVMDDSFVMLDGKIFKDKDGNFIREQMHFTGSDDLYRLVPLVALNPRFQGDHEGDVLVVLGQVGDETGRRLDPRELAGVRWLRPEA